MTIPVWLVDLLIALDFRLLELAHSLDQKLARRLGIGSVEPLIEEIGAVALVGSLGYAALLSAYISFEYVILLFWIGSVAFLALGLSAVLAVIGDLLRPEWRPSQKRMREAAFMGWSFLGTVLIYLIILVWWHSPMTIGVHVGVIVSFLAFAWVTFLTRPKPPKPKRKVRRGILLASSLLERLGLLPSTA